VYACKIEDDAILVDIDEQLNDAPIPRPPEPGWVRVRWRAQRLDWVPSVLAGLDRPFAIEEPDELRERVRALAEQLASWAEAR